eukprot:15473081-Alexandrium_andersonii.AAC.1
MQYEAGQVVESGSSMDKLEERMRAGWLKMGRSRSRSRSKASDHSSRSARTLRVGIATPPPSPVSPGGDPPTDSPDAHVLLLTSLVRLLVLICEVLEHILWVNAEQLATESDD